MNDKEIRDLAYKMFANMTGWFDTEEEDTEVEKIDFKEFKSKHNDNVLKMIAAITISSMMMIKEIADMDEKANLLDVQCLMNKVLFQVLVDEKIKNQE